MMPFFLVDRPNALEILLRATTHSAEHPLGIMTHAMISSMLRERLASISEEMTSDPSSIYLMVDSGAFLKKAAAIPEKQLFRIYEEMNASFGLVNDVLGDSSTTLRNSERAMRYYNAQPWRFRLVGVAQGKTLEDYLHCFRGLLNTGYQYVAVGGLLQKKPKSVRFTQVRREKFMYDVLAAIKEEFRPKWLFVLGAYHPKRHQTFQGLGVWGSDYKGWIFRYPGIQDGLIALSVSVRANSGFPVRMKQQLYRAQAAIRKYRYLSPHRKKVTLKFLVSLHEDISKNHLRAVIKALRMCPLQFRYTVNDLIDVFRLPLSKRRRIAISRNLTQLIHLSRHS